MKLQSDVFDLINSMDKQEKRYFKIFATRHTIGEKNDYITVFDELEKLDFYDEKTFNNSIKNEPYAKHISAVKNYLYKIILESLKSYHSKKTINSVLTDYLEVVEILYTKSLYNQCKKIITKGIRLSEQYERFAIQMEFYAWEKKVFQAQKYAFTNESDVKEIYNKENEIIKNLTERINYQKKSGLIRSRLFQKGFTKSEVTKKQLKDILKDPFFMNENKKKSFDARLTLYNTKMTIYELLDSRTQAINYAQKTIALLESDTNELKERLLNYVGAVSNLMITFLSTDNQYDKAEVLVKKLESIQLEPYYRAEHLRLKIFYSIAAGKSSLCYNRGDLQNAEACILYIKTGLQKFKTKVSVHDRILLFYTLAILHFMQNQLTESLYYINKIINKFEVNVREDIQRFARILFLIVHYEKGNIDLLEYAVRNTVNFMKKAEGVKKYETAIIGFFKQNITGKKTDKPKLISLKENLKEIFKDGDESHVNSYFDILAWVDAKIGDKSFCSVMRQKYLSL